MFLNYADFPTDIAPAYMHKFHDLFICSCGTYRVASGERLPTCRPKGRSDYQLIYIAFGKGHFIFNAKDETVVEAGQMVLYKPYEYQNYFFIGEEHPIVYWIHFNGSDMKDLFGSHNIPFDGQIIHSGTSNVFSSCFEKIIKEIQLQSPYFEEAIHLSFLELIIHIGRSQKPGCDTIDKSTQVQISMAINYFRAHYSEEIDIDQYIRERDINISSFYHKFKQFTGISPLQYIIGIRIANSKQLLIETDYSVKEISNMVGYSNSLYFSRLFRKNVWVSPMKYREQNV